MKAWQKVQVSPRCTMALLFSLAMFALGVILGIAQERYVNGKKANECQVQPQPTPPMTDAPKPPNADDSEEDEEPNPEIEKRGAVNPPRNVLGDIAAELRESMTAAELDAIIAKHTLGDDSLMFYTEKEHRPAEQGLPNGVDVERRMWQWRQDEGHVWRVDRTDIEWVTQLSVTLYNNTTVDFTYYWHREVDRGLMVK